VILDNYFATCLVDLNLGKEVKALWFTIIAAEELAEMKNKLESEE